MTNSYLTARLPDDLPNDPMHWVDAWLIDAADKEVKRNPNSMAIITSGSDARPSARMVLCKGFHADPGYLVFYTNYKSNKARQIEENSNVAVLFHWDQLGRQVRIEGQAVRSPEAESDAVLDFLYRHCENPAFHMRLRWQPDSIDSQVINLPVLSALIDRM